MGPGAAIPPHAVNPHAFPHPLIPPLPVGMNLSSLPVPLSSLSPEALKQAALASQIAGQIAFAQVALAASV